jgi:quinol monooxygenase YgiN
MTVILQQTMPEGLTLELLDQVTREMSADTDPPAGLIVHTHFEEDGRIRVVDVWDSQEQFDSFQESRLMPAMQKVAAGQGMDMSQAPQPETSIRKVHGLVKGR